MTADEIRELQKKWMEFLNTAERPVTEADILIAQGRMVFEIAAQLAELNATLKTLDLQIELPKNIVRGK